jgi:hypothetical protein
MRLESRFKGCLVYFLEGGTGRIQGMEGKVHEESVLWVVVEGRRSNVWNGAVGFFNVGGGFGKKRDK